jgi:hypothetical protein
MAVTVAVAGVVPDEPLVVNVMHQHRLAADGSQAVAVLGVGAAGAAPWLPPG